jgi:signal peptidase II
MIALLALAAIVVILDQASKAWIRANLQHGEEIVLWPGVVHLSHVLNYGAAWGVLSGQRWLLIAVSVLVMAGVLAVARGMVERSVWQMWALGLIVGGAVGNLIDRVLAGAVTDMIDMDTSWQWLRNFPVFNLADSALTAGVLILLGHTLWSERAHTATEHREHVAP